MPSKHALLVSIWIMTRTQWCPRLHSCLNVDNKSKVENRCGEVFWLKKESENKVNLPWFTNSEWLLVLPVPLFWLRTWFEILIDDRLLWDWMVLFSISYVLVLQKSSDILCFFTNLPWIRSPFDGSSTAIIGWDFPQQPKQPLLCFNWVYLHIQYIVTKWRMS